VIPKGALVAIALAMGIAAPALADGAPTNIVQVLQARLEKGEIKLAYADDGHGYLASLLKALAISPQSQVLPFTRSSLQFDKISPQTPRAVYFNDEVAVGAVHEGEVIEILANDRRGGAVFYTLDAAKTDKPKLIDEGARCVACHGLVTTAAPGWIVANVTATPDGTPQIINPAHPFDLTDQTRPFEDRWGGWYVTGTSQNMRHLGNITATDPEKPFELPEEGGRTLVNLDGRFDPALTLAQGSDIVALMTLEHQTGFINRIYALNAQYSKAAMDDMVAYMTFADEVPLPGPITGSSGFVQMFAAQGPRDAKGRSLRAFDLKTHLFRYPLSYMIYSSAFDSLKPDIKAELLQRLLDALKAKGADGAAAIAILAATKPGLPASWAS